MVFAFAEHHIFGDLGKFHKLTLYYMVDSFYLFSKIIRVFIATQLNKMSLVINSNVFGLSLLFIFIFQIFTGLVLSSSFLPEAVTAVPSREEEDIENLVIDDFFWLHEQGVSIIFILLLIHGLYKMYLGLYDHEVELAWKSGVMLFVLIQVVLFFGLSLTTSHLSEITVMITVNAFDLLCWPFREVLAIILPSEFLDTDMLLRLSWAHYISPFFVLMLAYAHIDDLHYDWKDDNEWKGVSFQIYWWDDGFFAELSKLLDFCILMFCFVSLYYLHPDSLMYDFFSWGDIGIETDVRFLGVSPHWYFRPYMAWLVVCPHFWFSMFGLFFFFIVLYYQVTLFGYTDQGSYNFSGNSLDSVALNTILKKLFVFYLRFFELFYKYLVLDTIFSFFLGKFKFISSIYSFFYFFDRLNPYWEQLSVYRKYLGENPIVQFVLTLTFLFECKFIVSLKRYIVWAKIRPLIKDYSVSYYLFELKDDISDTLEWDISFSFFLWSIIYTFSYLPFGRFFVEIGGDRGSLIVFLYMYLYVTFVGMRFCNKAYVSRLHLLN